MDDAHRLSPGVQHREGVEIGLGAEGFQHFVDGRVFMHCRLLAEKGGEVVAFLVDAADGLQRW
ncbi:hypothetical protein D3C85_1686190 [compost metagenome]